MGIILVRNFQFPTAVNHIGCQTVEGLDFRVAAAFAEILHGNIPKGITLYHSMDTVGFLRSHRVDGNSLVGEYISAGVLISSSLCIGKNAVCSHLGFAVRPGLTHTVIAGSQLFRILLDSVFVEIRPGITQTEQLAVDLVIGADTCISAYFTAASVSPPREEIRDAEKEVTVDI